MDVPELIFVAGCNAAGKSTFIRTRLNELEGFQILMTDVYKERTKSLAAAAISQRQHIIIETVFNDASFTAIIDQARNAGYHTSLIALFLDSPRQSQERVSNRIVLQKGIEMSEGNVRINFNESFKNIATYFLYFDRADFIYTGEDAENKLIMSFRQADLLRYKSSPLNYPQKFAAYSFRQGRLDEAAYRAITLNQDFSSRE